MSDTLAEISTSSAHGRSRSMVSPPSHPSPLLQRLSQVIHREVSIDDFEQFVYSSPEMEGELGVRDYHELLAFDYRGRHAEHELRKLLTALYERRRPGMLARDRAWHLADGLRSGAVDLVAAVDELAWLHYRGHEWVPRDFTMLDAMLGDVPHPDEYAQWDPHALRTKQPEWDARREEHRAEAVAAAETLIHTLRSAQPGVFAGS